MGWLRAVRDETTELKSNPNRSSVETKANLELDEERTFCTERLPISASLHPQELQPLPFVPHGTPDSELPFLSAAEFSLTAQKFASDQEEQLYIVVDEIVYNCTQFVHEHPGGP